MTDDLVSKQAATTIQVIPKEQHGRTFQEIVVEYLSYNTYPEYKGKPYFSIKYTENGQEFIGYGTYKPEVLSEYLKEYFMPSAQPDSKETSPTHKALDTISRQAAIDKIEKRLYETAFNNVGVKQDVDETLVDVAENRLENWFKELPSVQPDLGKYEYHYDHTDCIWYRPEARNRCPVTCAQYRDGKGYRPYRRGEQYEE